MDPKTPARPLSESMEDYLKTILRLSETSGVARIRDITRTVGVKASSAAHAVQTLAKDGLVTHETYGYVTLTRAGKKIAQDVSRRQKILFRFLTEILQIDAGTAARDACGMEHSLSPKSLGRLIRFIEFMGPDSPKARAECLPRLKEYYEKGIIRHCSSHKPVKLYR